MKKRNLIILLSVLVAGVAALIVVNHYGSSSTLKQDYHIADVNSITRIYLVDKQDSHVLLSRNPGGTGDSAWMVDDQYYASTDQVNLLTSTLHDMRMRQPVNKAAAGNVIKSLAANSIKVEVYQRKPLINWFGGKLRLFTRERLTATYFIGHETQDQLGTYALREGDKLPVVLHIPGFRGYLSPRFFTNPVLWRSHRVVDLAVQQIQSVSVDIPAKPEESFTVVRQGEGFRFEVGPNHLVAPSFDTARVAQMLSSFVQLNFDEYARAVPQAELDTTFSKAPRTILTITDIAGHSRELKTYIKYANPNDAAAMPDTAMYEVFDLNRLYAVLDQKDTVLIQYYIFDNILQPASFFLGQPAKR